MGAQCVVDRQARELPVGCKAPVLAVVAGKGVLGQVDAGVGHNGVWIVGQGWEEAVVALVQVLVGQGQVLEVGSAGKGGHRRSWLPIWPHLWLLLRQPAGLQSSVECPCNDGSCRQMAVDAGCTTLQYAHVDM